MTDVLCTVMIDCLEFYAALDKSPSELIAEARRLTTHPEDYDPQTIFAPSARVHWDTFTSFIDLWTSRLDTPARIGEYIVRALGRVPRWTAQVQPLVPFPEDSAKFYLNGYCQAIPMVFANLQASGRRLDARRLEITLSQRPGDKGSGQFFAITAGFLRLLPTLLGLPEAAVTSVPGDHRCVFTVVLPRRTSWVAVFLAALRLACNPRELRALRRDRQAAHAANIVKVATAHLELEAKVLARTAALESANAELKSKLEMLRQTEKIANLGTWTYDITTGLLYFSEQSCRIFGLPPTTEPTPGHFIQAFLPQEDLEALRRHFEECLQTGKLYEIEHRIITRKGEVRYLYEKAAFEKDDRGRPVRLVGTMYDMTLRKAHEESLIRAKDSADSANRTKTAFLASMSHEIRTPMTSVLGFADLLTQVDLPAEKRQAYLEKIIRNSRHLLALIDEILDLSKIEAGHMHIQPSGFSPILEIAQALDLLRVQVERKSLHLRLYCLSTLPDTIVTDQLRFRQILLNLVGNALKFTDQGEVRVLVSAIEHASVPMLEVQVVDTGIGIEPELHDTLFQPFAQINPMSTRPRSGTGLGLALARNIANALGGETYLERSTVGVGSTFVLRLPVQLPTSVVVAATSSAQRSPTILAAPSGMLTLDQRLPNLRLRGLRVMLVEDNSDIQDYLRGLLCSLELTVTTADDGFDCLQQLEVAEVDLIVMDMQMPKLDGFAATAELRRRGFNRPIIAITAFALVGAKERCLAAGCSDFLPKPVEALPLILTIAKWAALRSQTVGGAEAKSPPAPTSTPLLP